MWDSLRLAPINDRSDLKKEVKKEFQEYKTATEHCRRDEQKELEKIRAELDQQKKHHYEIEQCKCKSCSSL